MLPSIRELLNQKILFLDGAFGTLVNSFQLSEADYRGQQFKHYHKNLKENHDVLCLTQPEVVKKIHKDYLSSGADIIETNSFNSNAISQAYYDLEGEVYNLNLAAVELARAAVDEYRKIHPRPCFVAGSIGPTNINLSRCQNSDSIPPQSKMNFETVVEVYKEQMVALIKGGVDVLLLETSLDRLNIRAALKALAIAEEEFGRKTEFIVSMTLTKSDINSEWAQACREFIECVSKSMPLAVGLNCSFGSKSMLPFLKELAKTTDLPICCYPSAGLPDPANSMHYPESIDVWTDAMKELAELGLLNLAGGCCGTTPNFIKSLAEKLKAIPPR